MAISDSFTVVDPGGTDPEDVARDEIFSGSASVTERRGRNRVLTRILVP